MGVGTLAGTLDMTLLDRLTTAVWPILIVPPGAAVPHRPAAVRGGTPSLLLDPGLANGLAGPPLLSMMVSEMWCSDSPLIDPALPRSPFICEAPLLLSSHYHLIARADGRGLRGQLC